MTTGNDAGTSHRPMNTPMRFTIDPNPAETARGCAAMVEATLPPTYAAAIVFVVYMVIIAGAFVIVPSTPMTAIVPAIGGLVLAMIALQAEARRRSRKASENDPHTLEHHQLELSVEGIRAWCEHVDTRYTWHGITRVVETKEFYVFIRGSGGGPFLPKRVIPTGQENDLRALVRRSSPDRGAGLAREVQAPAT